MSKASSKTTTDHDEIREWAEARNAQPACVRATGGKGDVGMIRLDFPGFSGADSLEPIEWDEWFEAFDANGLALIYQDTTADGEQSNFNKLVSREGVEEGESSGRSGSSGKTAGKSASSGSKSAKGSDSKSAAAKSSGAKSTGTHKAAGSSAKTRTSGAH